MDEKFPVLIVDDEKISRKVLANSLEKVGYSVHSAGNGREALEMLEAEYFPLVITDWVMPEVDGLELCRAIREAEFPGYVFIIMLTKKSSKEDIIKGLGSGADDFLVKPVNQAELLARLNTGSRVLGLEKTLKKVTEEVRMLSITDPLVKCYNRAYLSEQLPGELKRARRYGHPLSLVLFDIDHFKKVNDTYGHMAGDHVLKEFVSCIILNIRKQVDWLVRYGGEEFVLVLPETDLKGALILLERLVRSVADMNTVFKNIEIPITVSYGGVSCEFDDDLEFTYEDLLKVADDYLYKAKNNGRNRGYIEKFKGLS